MNSFRGFVLTSGEGAELSNHYVGGEAGRDLNDILYFIIFLTSRLNVVTKNDI